MPTAAADRMVILGRLCAPWGIKGAIKVESYTDPPEGLLEYPVWNVATRDGGWEQVKIRTGRPHGAKRLLVVEIDGVGSPEDVRRYVEREVAMPRSALPPTAPGEYYWEDLPGCRVTTLEGLELGVVSHLLDFPANAVLVVRDGTREHWLPLVSRHVKKVDLGERHVTVDWDPVEG